MTSDENSRANHQLQEGWNNSFGSDKIGHEQQTPEPEPTDRILQRWIETLNKHPRATTPPSQKPRKPLQRRRGEGAWTSVIHAKAQAKFDLNRPKGHYSKDAETKMQRQNAQGACTDQMLCSARPPSVQPYATQLPWQIVNWRFSADVISQDSNLRQWLAK